jgi:hypothetical protein
MTIPHELIRIKKDYFDRNMYVFADIMLPLLFFREQIVGHDSYLKNYIDLRRPDVAEGQ